MKKLADLSVSQTFKSKSISKKSWKSHNIFTRTERSVKFQEKSIKYNENKFCLKPISDLPIIKNLENFQFPHPQLLISFLSMHHRSSNAKIKEILIPYLLTPDFSFNNVIDSIADSLSLKPSDLLQRFTSSLDCHKAKEEWEKRYNGIPINTNLKITKKWSLSTLDDLESLHLLACSVNCRIYLLIDLISPINSDENTIFSTIVGPTNDSSFCLFFLCESSTELIYSKPMFFSKQVHPIQLNFPLLKRITLPSKKYAFYLNFSQLLKELSSAGESFNSISTHFIVDPTITEPILSFSYSNQLKIEVRHPNDDYSYRELLEKLEHISSSFSTTEPAIIDDHFVFNFNLSKNQKVKFHSNRLITVHSIQEKEIELNKLHEITRISQIDELAWSFHSLNFPPITKSCDMKLFQLIRFLFPFLTKYKTYQTKKIETSPIITTHTDDFSLSEASKHPYVHFLCMHSIFNASTKSRTISCKKCGKNRMDEERSEVVMIPVRTVSNNCLSSPYITWICIDCFKRLNNREKLTIKGQFPMFHEVVDVCSTTRIQSEHNMMLALAAAEERIHMSIMSIRSQPIGSLRSLVPRIDSCFEQLKQIMRMFRQRLVRMKNVPAIELATVRNEEEYKARLGCENRAVRVAEPDIEAVDYEMFELYLKGFDEKTAGTTEYLLTQPESDIRQEIVEEAIQKMQELCTTISAKIDSVEIKYSNPSSKNGNDSGSNSNDNDDDDNGSSGLQSGVLSFGVTVNRESDSVSCSPIITNVYTVHCVECGSFITSSPLFTIKTRKFLKGLSFYNDTHLLAVISSIETASTELYIIGLSNTNLDSVEVDGGRQSPCLVIEGVSDCEVSFTSDCSTLAVLGVGGDENPLYIVSYDEEEAEWRSEFAGSFPATKVEWSSSSDSSVLYAAGDDFFCVLRSGENGEDGDEEEEEAEVVDMPSHTGSLVKLIPSQSAVWALFDSGECVLLQPPSAASTEEEDSKVEAEEITESDEDEKHIKFISHVRFVDGFLASENVEFGVAAVDEEGRVTFIPFPLSRQPPPPSVSVHPLNGRLSYNFPSGVFDYSKSSTFSEFSCSQVSLSFCELFPVLCGFFFTNCFFLVRGGKKAHFSYRPQEKNGYLNHSIRSFYVSEMTHVSLHHIEDAIFLMNIKSAKIVTFIDFGLQNCGSFIDSIFGTSFTFCESDGVWVAMRTVNGLIYLIVLIKVPSGEVKNQVLFDATTASFLCLNGDRKQRNVFFLAENEMALFDTLTNIDGHAILPSNNYAACALIFVRNSKQKIFEFKTIEASLNNCIQNATIESFQYEFFDDYSELMINPLDADGSELDCEFSKSFRSDWLKKFDEISPVNAGQAIDKIKKMISLMATLYQFKDIEPSSVINNCVL